jgi:hypothetical protein
MDRKEFLNGFTRPLRVESVSLPDGRMVHVRELTAKERDEFEAAVTATRGRRVEVNLTNVRARLVVATICDETGKRILADSDVAMVGDMPAAVIDPIYAAAARLSGLSGRDEDDLAGKSESRNGG